MWVLHLSAVVLFGLLSILLTWPLASRIETHVPGVGADDNMVFLWNVWWMRQVLASGGDASLFHTPFLFHPDGLDLVLHAHTAVNALLGATVFGSAPLIAAFNLTILVTGALNGLAAYLLAWKASGRWMAALTAGVFFAACPSLVANQYGHFNYHTAWGLPLFAYAFLETLTRASWRWALASGVVLALVGYTNYYYFIYLCAFILCAAAGRWLRPRIRLEPRAGRGNRVDGALLLVAAVGLVAAFLIFLTGGLVLEFRGVRLSLTTGTNLKALATLAVLCWLWRRWRPSPTIAPVRAHLVADSGMIALVLVVAAALMLPIIARAAALWQAGEYVSRSYVWRSAPAGVDVGTLLIGNPFNGLWGEWVMGVYGTLGMTPFDGPLWMGVVPIVLVMTRHSWRDREEASLWLLVLGVFLVWALGPYLLVLGVQTGLPLPQTLLRYVPIVSNAHIPSHAAILVYLAASVLLAIALSGLRSPRAGRHTAVLLAATLVDFSPAPFPTVRPDRPRIYERLAALPAGAVLEIPFGIRDGFGEQGRLDPRVMYYQTIHGKPIAGGYISRLPASATARSQSGTFGTLLQLSDREPGDPPIGLGDQAFGFVRRSGFKYVVVNKETATTEVQQFVRAWPLRLIMTDGSRELYAVE